MNLKHALTTRGFDTLFIGGPMELALRWLLGLAMLFEWHKAYLPMQEQLP